MIVSEDLVGHKQTANVVVKGNKTLGFVKNVKMPFRGTKEKAYRALVQPMVEFVLIVWRPHQDELRHNIKMVQRRASLYVMARYRTDSVTAMLQKLSWNTLKLQRLKARITMRYQVVHNLVMISADKLKQKEELLASTRGHDS